MKKYLSILLTLISLTAFGQSVPHTAGVATRVNDSTAYINARNAAGNTHDLDYADIFWNNQATTPHWDIWNGSSYDHVFDFNGGGGGGGTVTSVSGTTNRITSTGGVTPVIDISSSYIGQSSITTTGTLTSGSSGSGFTLNFGASTLSGDLPFSNITQIAGLSVLGVTGSSTADVAAITAGTDAHVLRRSGTSLGFGTIGNSSIADLAFSKLTSVPTTLSGYGITDAEPKYKTHNVQTGNYTAVLGDASKIVLMRSVNPQTFTVPPFSSVAYIEGTRITVVPDSTGVITVAAGSGVLLESSSGVFTSCKDCPMVLEKKNATNSWYLWNGSGGDFESGTYTPTLTNTANVAASTAYLCTYMRVDNTVTFSGRVDIDPTTTATTTQLGISLPIISAFTTANQAGGTAFAPGFAGDGAAVLSDATNDRLLLEYKCVDVTNHAYYFTVTYQRIP